MMIEAAAKAAYRKLVGVDEVTAAEHFAWYERGKSNPNSCVHYSNVAKAYELAEAAFTAALSSQWRGMESAPKDGTQILAAVPWLPYAKALFWATYANEWRCPSTEDRHKYDPVLWQPLPKPPFVLDLPPPPTQDERKEG